MSPSRVAAAVVGLTLLAACSSDPSTPTAQQTSLPPVVASPAASVPASPATVPSAPVSQPTTPPFPATTAVDTGEPTGGSLTVTAVRVAAQDGYDRVVFELKGKVAGAPGWRVEYVDQATSQGSGDPVEVKGAAILSVVVTGVGYPFDTGQTEADKDPAVPSGLRAVRDVALDNTFEGQYAAFVGLTAKRPFRVFRLADPARVVVDVRHN